MMTTNRIHAHFDPWTMWNQLHGELSEFWGAGPSFSEPPLNLWAKPEEAILSIQLPGRELKDIQVSVHRDVVTIQLENDAMDSPQIATAMRVERSGSALTRQVRIPFEVDAERVDATYERGLLRIHLYRHQSTMPTKITVSAG